MNSTFENHMNKAREEKLKARKDKEQRYCILRFPAFHGDPIYTDNMLIAKIIFWFRGFKYIESRLIDRKFDTHKVF